MDTWLQSADICFRKQALKSMLINVHSFRQWITRRPFSPIKRPCILLFTIYRKKLTKITAVSLGLQKHWQPSLETCIETENQTFQKSQGLISCSQEHIIVSDMKLRRWRKATMINMGADCTQRGIRDAFSTLIHSSLVNYSFWVRCGFN